MKPTTYKCFMAELLGTFFLLFIGLGALMLSMDTGVDLTGQGSAVQMSVFSPVTQALVFGLTLMATAYAMGHVSGAHFNPAVSLGMMLSGNLRIAQFPVYIFAQLLGAILSVAALRLIFQGNESAMVSELSAIGNAYDQGRGLQGFTATACALVEGVGVCLLTYLYISSEKEQFSEKHLGLAKGAALAAALLISVPLTNGGLNPARSMAGALIVGGDAMKQLWFFLVVPILGAVAGVVCDRMMAVDRSY